jgi:iron(III) transport system substrate-binding protein
MAMVLGVPFLLRPAEGDQRGGGAGQPRLVIYSPHNDQIRYEFEYAFNQWRLEQGEVMIEFDWRAGGGGTDIRKKIIAEFTAKGANGLEAEGIGADLLFGGGDYEHNKLAKGISVTRDDEDYHFAITTPVRFADGQRARIFPEATIGGERLYHAELSWVGTALSSFGIVYNRDVLRLLDLNEPGTWRDLGDPGYRGWIALADPAHSGSIAATYNAILRRHGWDEGWRTLRRVFANARYFTAGASKVPVDVSAGEAAAGMCIDFYGRYQAGAVGGDRLAYVAPPRMTAITADPIAILRGAPQRELANEFVLWVLSPQGQGLWQHKRGTPGGPDRHELRRLPVRRDMYEPAEMQHWADAVNPFDIAEPFPDGMPNFFATVALVSHAMAIDIHADLTAAWAAIENETDAKLRAEMIELFERMPEPLIMRWPNADIAENWLLYLSQPQHPLHADTAAALKAFLGSFYARWSDADNKLRDRLTWTIFFRENYRQIVALSRAELMNR